MTIISLGVFFQNSDAHSFVEKADNRVIIILNIFSFKKKKLYLHIFIALSLYHEEEQTPFYHTPGTAVLATVWKRHRLCRKWRDLPCALVFR